MIPKENAPNTDPAPCRKRLVKNILHVTSITEVIYLDNSPRKPFEFNILAEKDRGGGGGVLNSTPKECSLGELKSLKAES
jgi:hypothetical protein